MVKILQFLWVGALDKDPIKTGAEYAKSMVGIHLKKLFQAVLISFISTSYRTDQNTLYSMRWNQKSRRTSICYDIKWAESNATIIADFYKNMKTEGKYFKYFVYKDDSKHLKK